jgi:prepilin-type N-terminal cleavage/methylation domain-containing protein
MFYRNKIYKMTQNNERNRDYVLCHPRNSTRENYLGSSSGSFRLDSGLRRNDNNSKDDSNRGFSLVELIVVMAIFTIITSITVFNYGKFSSNLIVTNLAYESALAVRQAQVYGISVKQTKASQNLGDKNFNASYGVWFSTADLQKFYLFADNEPINISGHNLRAVDASEDEENFGMNGSNTISNFCVTNSGGVRCSKDGEIDSMSIIFKRPEPNANIYGFLNSTQQYTGTKAEIMFTSGRGDKTARMTVTNTGQISVDSCNNIQGDPKECPK